MTRLSLLFALSLSGLLFPLTAADKVKVLLVDGQNNHAWQETSPLLVSILEKSGRFEVAVSTSPAAAPKAPRAPQNPDDAAKAKFAAAMKEWEARVAEHKKAGVDAWAAWKPDFAAYDVVVSNYNGETWPDPVRAALETYVKNGGGFVSVHAANNSFPEWAAYNEMIGVGGWGGRSELSGPYLRKREGKWTFDPTAGRGGSHGQQHEFVLEIQDGSHPIVKGLPSKWLHAQDELYDRLRGPAKSVTVLGAAFSAEDKGGSGEWEPLLMVIPYGKGRVFHTALGHSTVSMSGLGFQETLKRGTEWAATGSVTFPPVGSETLTLEKVAVVP
ncbi:MAG: ThuA domain-containing protein [Verrucomicrobiae bacterium]|nr:ThuA domain-containing protein [Verrucomicrobiae bacterium]